MGVLQRPDAWGPAQPCDSRKGLGSSSLGWGPHGAKVAPLCLALS